MSPWHRTWSNTKALYELLPTECRYVRLTITDWPHIANFALGIMEFTVFGKPVEAPKR